MHDPEFPDIPDMTALRYTQIPSFLRAPMSCDSKNLDIGIVGIAYDGALTNRASARHGPREVRNASSMMPHHVTKVNPYANARIADVGDITFNTVFDIEKTHAEISSFIKQMTDANVSDAFSTCSGSTSFGQ